MGKDSKKKLKSSTEKVLQKLEDFIKKETTRYKIIEEAIIPLDDTKD
jgi:hypothetical protein